MRFDTISVVVCEWVAFIAWILSFSKIKETRYKLFAIYLGFMAIGELLHLLYYSHANKWSNVLVLHVNVPLQFLFFFYFLLYKSPGWSKKLAITFSIVFMIIFLAERFNMFLPPVNFDSLSYGVGTLMLIIAIVIALKQIFNAENISEYNRTSLFWILLGLILFYIGTLPYNNFRNYFWSKPSYYSMTYFLHYLSQALCCAMYLLFAYSVKWKTR